MSDIIEDEYDEPKKADPFILLPKSNMNLVSCKDTYNREKNENRCYFSTGDGFWKDYDPVGFSIHLGRYKYNSDLSSIGFVRRNTVGGMVRDMDDTLTHKNMFGVYKILCDNTSSTVQYSIVCVFITRGLNILPGVFGLQYEYFSWEKLECNYIHCQNLIFQAFHSPVDGLFEDKIVDHHILYV